MIWKSFEDRVRHISSVKFSCVPQREKIVGVNLDCIMKVNERIWVIIEITTEKKVDKIRIDSNRLIMVRRHLFEKRNIMAQTIIVTNYEPTPAMKEIETEGVELINIDLFERSVFDYSAYANLRKGIQFGSAVNPFTGEPDRTSYVPVAYRAVDGDRALTLEEIVKHVSSQTSVVILGEYGSGKSRCVKELFSILSSGYEEFGYTLAIDLRTVWGLNTFDEVIRRHFSQMGLSDRADFAVRAFLLGGVNVLLDGFDEIGTQAWSENPRTLRTIRREALEGVHDLVTKCKGGVVVTGRDHYFDSEGEMFDCLGVRRDGSILIKCNDEFNEYEMHEFIGRFGRDVVVPDWLPKRPLMCQALASIEDEGLAILFEGEGNDVQFWHSFMKILCQRDASIRRSFDPEVMFEILLVLARETRFRSGNVGPISYASIQKAFGEVLGEQPIAEAGVMLQRLPGLGRTSAESEDRQFVDTYILDGLRAVDVSRIVESFDRSVGELIWINPLSRLGQRVAALEYAKRGFIDLAVRSLVNFSTMKNHTLTSDILASLLMVNNREKKIANLIVSDGRFSFLDLSGAVDDGIRIVHSVIDDLVMPESRPKEVLLDDCLIDRVHGIAGAGGVPDWMVDCVVEKYSNTRIVSAIKALNISVPHRILVTVLKKTFFQKGGGRKEEALLRGLGQVDRKNYTPAVLKILEREHILKKTRGDSGAVYVPERSMVERVGKMMVQLNQSQDEIWAEVGRL